MNNFNVGEDVRLQHLFPLFPAYTFYVTKIYIANNIICLINFLYES